MNARLQQNTVNDGKKKKKIGVYLTSIIFSCVNNPCAVFKVVDFFLFYIVLIGPG